MSVLKDVQLAVRLLRRNWMPTLIALASIALSVGATAVVFAAVKSVLLDPLPFARAGELVQLRSEYPSEARQSSGDWVFWNDTQEVIRRTQTLAAIGIYHYAALDLAGEAGSTPQALYGLKVSADLFPALGVHPMLGRNIGPQEDQPGQPEEMILSYGLWARRFHSDPNVVGRTVQASGQPVRIIGVMPPEFNFPLIRAAQRTPSPYTDFWSPLSNTPNARTGGLGAVARLRPGVTLAQARQDLASISAALAHDFPATNSGKILTANFLRDRTVGLASNGLELLLGAALIFLLIGCANVANLLLVRGFARQREISVRLAMGAGPGRIVRQLLTESCVLAVLGGAGGYLITLLAWKLLPAIAPLSIPRLAAARADGSILAFALALAVINGVLFGIGPALRLARSRQTIFAASGSRGAAMAKRDATRSALVIAEVALSVLLVVTGGQLLGSFAALVNTDPGFQQDHVLASIVLPSPARYPAPEQRSLFYKRILDSVRALPGVESAGTVDALPFSGENHGGFISTVAAPAPQARVSAEMDVTGGEYLQAMGVRLLEGRWFREEDMNDKSDTAMVDSYAAQRLWPGESAIGQRVCIYCTADQPDNWKQVIGVVTGTRHVELNEAPVANVYTAAGAMRESYFVVARTMRPLAELDRDVRHAIADLDPQQPVFQSASMRAFVSDSFSDRRFVLILLGITGCLALLLSAAGVYGVISYTTARRTQEIGIRMALGATPGNVRGLVVRQGFTTVGTGLALGLGGALPLMRILKHSVPGLTSLNPAHIALAALLVASSAAPACWVPARRATRIDPVAALAQE